MKLNKILIVDDEQGIRSVLSDVLVDEGFEVVSVAQGRECLPLLEKDCFDLVVLDVWLPDVNGIDLLQDIKKLSPNLPVVIISGHANVDSSIKAVALGAYDFLEKPLSIEKMVNVINNALQVCQLEEENRNLKEALVLHKTANIEHKNLAQALQEFEKKYIEESLKLNGTLQETSKQLGISQSELEEKIAQFSIKWE